MSEDYVERRVIVQNRTKPREGKIKRWIVNPVFKVAGIDKDGKKDRMNA